MRDLIFVPWVLLAVLTLAALSLSPAKADVPARAAAPAGGSRLFLAFVDAGPIH